MCYSYVVGILMVLNPLMNLFKHSLHFEFHIQAIEAEKSNTEFLQSPLAFPVLVLFEHVAVTINLDCEIEHRAVEIDDVFTNRFLPMEVEAHHLLALQLFPEKHLRQLYCFASGISQVLSAFDCIEQIPS